MVPESLRDISMRKYHHAAYLDILQPAVMKRRINAAIDAFMIRRPIFDTFVFSGMSGALFTPRLAATLKKETVLVRKPNDMNARSNMRVNHSPYDVEGFADVKRYIIVDDQVSMGNTARHIITHMKNFAPDAMCVCIYCYFDNDWLELTPIDWRLKELFEPGGILHSDASKTPTVSLADDPTVLPESSMPFFSTASIAMLRASFRGVGESATEFTKSEEPPTMSEVSDDPLGDTF